MVTDPNQGLPLLQRRLRLGQPKGNSTGLVITQTEAGTLA